MVYKIMHDAFPDSESVFVSITYGRRVMEYLIAYIQNAFGVVAPDYGLSPQMLTAILRDVYGCRVVCPQTRKYVALDILGIDAKFSPGRKRVMAIRMFERDGLHDALTSAAHAIEARDMADGGGASATLRIETVGHGSVCGGDICWTGFRYSYCKIGESWGEVVCKPDASPDPGYEVEGWFLEDGTRLDHDTKITGTQLVTVKFRKINGVVP